MAAATRHTADDWIAAAYRRFRDDGLAAVKVEAIARDLAATKGSFYHHFPDRRALVEAVMERWEAEETGRFIEEADAATGPQQRLEVLFHSIGRRRFRGEDHLYLEADREGVAERVRNVTTRRVDYVAAALVELGVEPDEARRRAVAALAITLGLRQLARGGARALLGAAEALESTLLNLMTAR